jgi:hypothetical protein
MSTDGTVRDIEFTTVAQGEYDGPHTAKEEVIRSLDDYSAFFDGSPPNNPDVDWEKEVILAVALGERRSGGYSVEITKIILHLVGIRQGFNDISYVETTPSGITTDALTYPYHAVKCQREGSRYAFIKQ